MAEAQPAIVKLRSSPNSFLGPLPTGRVPAEPPLHSARALAGLEAAVGLQLQVELRLQAIALRLQAIANRQMLQVAILDLRRLPKPDRSLRSCPCLCRHLCPKLLSPSRRSSGSFHLLCLAADCIVHHPCSGKSRARVRTRCIEDNEPALWPRLRPAARSTRSSDAPYPRSCSTAMVASHPCPYPCRLCLLC